VRREIRALDATLPVFNVQPMTDVVARSMARTSFTLLLLGVASGVALVLGAVGIYGVISYMVSLRTREIGVRIAVGARPADVSRMVSGRGVVLALVGVGIGLAAALAVTRSLQALLYDVSPADPLTLAGAAALLVAVSFVASWIPARRAARVDPLVAMRADA
jgi:ABC-type antimicrobial peptide transport system permease subunit